MSDVMEPPNGSHQLVSPRNLPWECFSYMALNNISSKMNLEKLKNQI